MLLLIEHKLELHLRGVDAFAHLAAQICAETDGMTFTRRSDF